MHIFMWRPRFCDWQCEYNNETKVVVKLLHPLNFYTSRYSSSLWNQFLKRRMLSICIYSYLECTFYALTSFTAWNSGNHTQFIYDWYHLKCVLMCVHQIKMTNIEVKKNLQLLRSVKITSILRIPDVKNNFELILLSHFISEESSIVSY